MTVATKESDSGTGKQNTAPEQLERLNALTGVRFVAALHVVAFHNWDVFAGAPESVRGVIGYGYTGVSLFFVLSGFILAYTYCGPTARPISTRSFFIARFVRVYPAYALALLMSLPLFIYFLARTLPPGQAGVKALLVAIPSMFLLQAWIPHSLGSLNPPGWSLSVEGFLYLLFPLIGAWLSTLGRKSLFPVMLGLWLIACAPGVLHAIFVDGGGSQVLPGPAWLRPSDPAWNLFFAVPLLHVAQFSMGAAAGVLFHRVRPWVASRRAARPLGATLGEIATIGLLLACFHAASAGWITEPLLNTGFLAAVYIPLLLLLAVGSGWIARGLSLPLLVLLGEASYGIYIFQDPVRSWLIVVWRAVGLTAAPVVFFLLYLTLLCTFSIAVVRAEERLRPALRAWLSKRLIDQSVAA